MYFGTSAAASSPVGHFPVSHEYFWSAADSAEMSDLRWRSRASTSAATPEVDVVMGPCWDVAFASSASVAQRSPESWKKPEKSDFHFVMRMVTDGSLLIWVKLKRSLKVPNFGGKISTKAMLTPRATTKSPIAAP